MKAAGRWQRGICTLAAAVLGILSAATPAPAAAWGQDGHWLVCDLAYHQVTEDARDTVDRLAAQGDYDTFAEGCHYPDDLRRRATEHYVNYARSVVEVVPLTEPANDPNVVSAIIEDVDRLADRSLSDQERGTALLFLGHWVGDVHQPLHVNFADDRGGNSFRKRGTCGARNLHAVWDTCIVQREVMGLRASETRLPILRRRARARAETADRLAKALPERDDADRIGDAAPLAMASESYRIVTHPSVEYCVRIEPDGSCRYEADNTTLNDGEDAKTVQIDEDYTGRMKPVVEKSLLFASVRLAAMISAAVQ